MTRPERSAMGAGNGAGGELSTFALDVYWAAGRPSDAAVEAHLAACERCKAYLSMLDARRAALEVPAASAATPPSRAGTGARSKTVRYLWPATGMLALAAAALIFVRSRPQGEVYVASKGTPAVQILVHRDGDTRVWDGRTPVRPGDALALRVACEGLAYVTVAAPGAGAAAGAWARLSDAACPGQPDALPFTLRVDDEAGSEQLAVILSRRAMDDAALRGAIEKTTRAEDVWVARYVLPKDTGAGP